MKCQECGSEIRPGSRFCPHCGAQAPAAPAGTGGVQDADDYIPEAGRIDLPDAGHLIPAERPEPLAKALIGFAGDLK